MFPDGRWQRSIPVGAVMSIGYSRQARMHCGAKMLLTEPGEDQHNLHTFVAIHANINKTTKQSASVVRHGCKNIALTDSMHVMAVRHASYHRRAGA